MFIKCNQMLLNLNKIKSISINKNSDDVTENSYDDVTENFYYEVIFRIDDDEYEIEYYKERINAIKRMKMIEEILNKFGIFKELDISQS